MRPKRMISRYLEFVDQRAAGKTMPQESIRRFRTEVKVVSSATASYGCTVGQRKLGGKRAKSLHGTDASAKNPVYSSEIMSAQTFA